MRRVARSAIVPHSAEQMFTLVDDVERYPEFLHACSKASVHQRSDDALEATLVLTRGGVSREFTTRNSKHPFEAIDIALLRGPFTTLEGGWHFGALGEHGCRVSLDLEFEFESRLVQIVFGGFFEETCNSLVDAFTQRARAVYGVE